MKYKHAIVGWMLTTLVDEQREVVLAVLVEEVFADLLRALAGLSVSEKKKIGIVKTVSAMRIRVGDTHPASTALFVEAEG